MAVWIVTVILLLTLFLLVSEKVRVDLTALGVMVALMVTGILSPQEAVQGFSSPAVITVGAMFLISRAMIRTGAVGFISQKVIAYSKGSPTVSMLIILLVVGTASAFINNTPVVVLFIPVVMAMCCKFGLSPSRYLIPVSYASILAGTCTLIGTSTNIIVSDLSAAAGHGALGMFELAVLGVPIALIGIAFLMVAAPRLMPAHPVASCELDNADHRRYLAELAIPKGSPIIGINPEVQFKETYPDLEVLEVIRYDHIYYPDRDHVQLAADDLLLAKGSASDLLTLLDSKVTELPASEKGLRFGSGESESLVVELIIPPQSSLLGKRLMETQLARDKNLHIVAVKRVGLHYTETKILDIKLKIGDILLVWCAADKLEPFRGQADVIVVEDVHHEIVHKQKARRAGLIFTGVILAAGLGLADIMVCAMTGAFLMIAAGCLQLRDGYRALQGDVLILIAGTIALGTAMEKTGTSAFYANIFLQLFQGLGHQALLGGFIALTSLSTMVLSNNATAVLLLPIAVSTAGMLGVDPKPFIIAVCFGASACYATPIGYQTNLLVYGPGGYRFSDYLKLGLPLNFIVLIMGTLFIPVIWPF
jgi:di/tricarboxylate transporter